MRRLALAVLVALFGMGVAVPSAGATPAKKLDDQLGAMWSTILRTPASQNPFNPDASNPVSTCWDLGGIVAPFGPTPDGAHACTVKTGTKIFVAARAVECSKWELDPGKTNLLACAKDMEAKQPAIRAVTLDRRPISLTRVTTKVLTVTLPADNVFGAKPDDLTGHYQAIGDVAGLNPLTPGTHTIRIVQADPNPTITTVITVKPGR